MPNVDYEDIFEKADVGIALNDPTEGTIGVVNDRYTELLGYSQEELRTMKIEEISAEDPSFDQTKAMEKIQEALAGDPQRFDWLFEREDGSQFWGEVALKRTQIGQEDRLVAFVRDISQRKQYEKQLHEKNQRLEEFSSVVSHDLRNPLRTAVGRLELAREDCDSEHLEGCLDAVTRCQHLIDDLLTVAREGNEVRQAESVALANVVEECWQPMMTDEAALTVTADRKIRGDKARLQQLLENLIANAIEHGGPDVTVTVGELDDGFYIADDGPGIPPEERTEVFDAGYSTNDEGTGFGLSIVHQVVDAHDWDIHLTEAAGGGARFEITGVEVTD